VRKKQTVSRRKPAADGDTVLVTYCPHPADFDRTEVSGLKFVAYVPLVVPAKRYAVALKLAANPWFCIGPLTPSLQDRKSDWMNSCGRSDVERAVRETDNEVFASCVGDIDLDKNFAAIVQNAQRIKPRKVGA
jgi:hypothetical protein